MLLGDDAADDDGDFFFSLTFTLVRSHFLFLANCIFRWLALKQEPIERETFEFFVCVFVWLHAFFPPSNSTKYIPFFSSLSLRDEATKLISDYVCLFVLLLLTNNNATGKHFVSLFARESFSFS